VRKDASLEKHNILLGGMYFKITDLDKLKAFVSNVQNWRHTAYNYCVWIQEVLLPSSLGKNLPNISSLLLCGYFNDVDKNKECLGALQATKIGCKTLNLENFQFPDTALMDTVLASMNNMENLCVMDCQVGPRLLLPDLSNVSIARTKFLEQIDVSECQALKVLTICDCPSLKYIDGLEGLNNLKRLKIKLCDSLPFTVLQQLINECTHLEEVKIVYKRTSDLNDSCLDSLRELARMKKLNFKIETYLL
jgi:hypothetical protein